MKTKKPKKVNLRTLKATIQREFNRMVAHDKPCIKCKKTFEVMQCSHIHSIGAYPNLRFDIMNVFPMCGRDHRFWWHDEPGDAWEWFKVNFPGRYDYLQVAKNKHVGWTLENLTEVRKNIKSKNLKALLIAPELVVYK